METRISNLPFAHHSSLAIDALTPDQRADLLADAVENKWSAARLTKERDKLLGKPSMVTGARMTQAVERQGRVGMAVLLHSLRGVSRD